MSMKKLMPLLTVFFSLSIGLMFFSLITQPLLSLSLQEKEKDEPLTYNVSVSMVLVPLFAVGTNGKPVHDLTEKELELFINGEETPFLFNRYTFDDAEGNKRTSPKSAETPLDTSQGPMPGTKAKAGPEHRVVFIILDAIFNSLDGVQRGKEMAAQLVQKTTSNDQFIVIMLTPTQGLQYIAGPEPTGPDLINKIKNIPLKSRLWRENLFSKKRMPDNITYGMDDPRDDQLGSGNYGAMRELNVKMEKMQYMATIKRFGHLLAQFQHALNTITNPKIVFLISEGISRSAFEAGIVPSEDEGMTRGSETTQNSWSANVFDGTFRETSLYTGHISNFHMQYLREVSQSINRGGSVLYTINPSQTKPIDDVNDSGEMSLNYMARTSGGKHFQGSKVDTVIKEIKQTTSAYYEISFASTAVKGKNMDLQIKCKRTGVRIHTLRYASKSTPYAKMTNVQKKLFALNVVTGGSWSRMTGTVKAAEVKLFTAKIKNKSDVVEVTIPTHMQQRKADLFLIEQNPETNQINIRIKSQRVGSKERFNIKILRKKDVNQFLALIEPTMPYCIYKKIN